MIRETLGCTSYTRVIVFRKLGIMRRIQNRPCSEHEHPWSPGNGLVHERVTLGWCDLRSLNRCVLHKTENQPSVYVERENRLIGIRLCRNFYWSSINSTRYAKVSRTFNRKPFARLRIHSESIFIQSLWLLKFQTRRNLNGRLKSPVNLVKLRWVEKYQKVSG